MLRNYIQLLKCQTSTGIFFLALLILSSMVSPVASLDRKESEAQPTGLPLGFPEMENEANFEAQGEPRAQSGNFQPQSGVEIDCVSRAAQPLLDTASGDNNANLRSLSADGRYLVFGSTAANLLAGQTENNGVFLYDRVTRRIELVSRAAGTTTTQANGDSFNPAISGNGQFIAFLSLATNLVPGQIDTNQSYDVFLFDRLSGITQLVSRAAGTTTTTSSHGSGNYQGSPEISTDGRWIAYDGFSTDLVPGQTDTNNSWDVFLFDQLTGITHLVSKAAGTSSTTGNHYSQRPALSSDGQILTFQSLSTNLVDGQVDTNQDIDIFVFDLRSGITQLVSRATGTTTTTANQSSHSYIKSGISADGQWITFSSHATNLITGQIDTNRTSDIFLFNRLSGITELVSHHAGAINSTCDGFSFYSSLSSDGSWVVFQSSGSNLVSNQMNARIGDYGDIFLYNRLSGVTQLVSRAAGTSTTTGNRQSRSPEISANGQWVVFQSFATNLVPGQATSISYNPGATFVYDRVTETTKLAGLDSASTPTTGNGYSREPAISADGNWIAFDSTATNLIEGITDIPNPDVFLVDRNTMTPTLVTRHFPGAASQTGLGKSTLDFMWRPRLFELARWTSENRQSMSSDGRYIVFSSDAPNLVPGQIRTSYYSYNIFVRDQVTQTTTLVSRADGTTVTEGNEYSNVPAISADGRWIVYTSLATNLVPGQIDVNQKPNIFLYDRLTGITEIVSREAGTTATAGNSDSRTPAISADGRFIVYSSQSVNLVPDFIDQTPENDDIFVYDRLTRTTELVSRAAGTTATTGNGASFSPAISDDGKFIVFQSRATDLVSGQTTVNAGQSDIFVVDRETKTTTLVSRAAGTTTTTGNNWSRLPKISATGQFITFISIATNLVPSQTDTNGGSDVFVFDQASGFVQLVSRAVGTSTSTGNGYSLNPAISGDGNFIAYSSLATNLVSNQSDTNGELDVFVFNRVSGTTQLVSRMTGKDQTTGNAASTTPMLGANGQLIAFESVATNLAPGQTDVNGTSDVFVFDQPSGQIQLVSRTVDSPFMTGRRHSDLPQISQNSQHIVFQSSSNDLISDDYNNNPDVFVAEVLPPVNATLTGGGTICTTQSTSLTATVIGGTPPYTLTLTNGGGTQTGNSPFTFTVSPLATTTYAIQSGTDASGNPVTGNGSATVTVNVCTEFPSLLVADTINNRIQRFQGTTWSVVGPGTVGSGTGQFRTPEAVAFDQTGRIYVADTGNNRIQWSTNGGTTWAIFAATGSGLNQVNGPRGLALDRNGNLYVADGGNNRVVRFNNAVPGNAVLLATNGTTSGRVQNPNGLAIDTTFNLFIADTGNNRIQKITNASTQTLPNTGTVVAGIGSGLTSVRMPQGVAVDSVGNLYVADTGNNRVTRFAGGNPGTATLLAGSGTALGQVRAPEGVTISSFSTGPLAGGLSLIVSDTSNNRIQGRLLNATIWRLVGTPNGLGSSPGQFRTPSKIR